MAKSRSTLTVHAWHRLDFTLKACFAAALDGDMVRNRISRAILTVGCFLSKMCNVKSGFTF
jgi:hypothetical protein